MTYSKGFVTLLIIAIFFIPVYYMHAMKEHTVPRLTFLALSKLHHLSDAYNQLPAHIQTTLLLLKTNSAPEHTEDINYYETLMDAIKLKSRIQKAQWSIVQFKLTSHFQPIPVLQSAETTNIDAAISLLLSCTPEKLFNEYVMWSPHVKRVIKTTQAQLLLNQAIAAVDPVTTKKILDKLQTCIHAQYKLTAITTHALNNIINLKLILKQLQSPFFSLAAPQIQSIIELLIPLSNKSLLDHRLNTHIKHVTTTLHTTTDEFQKILLNKKIHILMIIQLTLAQ